MDRIDQLAIIGTGLLGTSLGLALKQRGFPGRLVGLGRREATLERARQRGAVDQTSTDPAAVLPEAKLVVAAVPLGGFEAVFKQLAPHQHAEMVVTDVGSTKAGVLAAAKRHLPRPEQFIGAHPMAGSEQAGPDAADPGLFEGKPCILTPDQPSDEQARAEVRSLWERVGMAVATMPAEAHDRQAATISHLPHILAGLLVETARERGGWELASTGFRDMTRLASANPPMWADILTSNREPIRHLIQTFQQQLQTMDERLAAADHQALLDWLQQQKDHRESWLTRFEDRRRNGTGEGEENR